MEYSNRIYKTDYPFSSTMTEFHSHRDTNIFGNWLDFIWGNRIKGKETAIVDKTNSISITNDEEQYAKDYIAIYDSRSEIIGTLDRTIKQINEIALLEDDWNDNGAKSFSKGLINRTLRIIKDLPVAPEAFPTAIGAIQIEYHKDDGSYLEFEIYESVVIQYKVDKNGTEYEHEMTNNKQVYKEIRQAVVDFYE